MFLVSFLFSLLESLATSLILSITLDYFILLILSPPPNGMARGPGNRGRVTGVVGSPRATQMGEDKLRNTSWAL